MFNHTISAILRGSWLIEKGFADAHIPLVLGMMKGDLSGGEFLKGRGEFEGPFFINASGQSKPAYAYDRDGRMVVNNPDQNSVAVIPFIGPMVKYNGACGEPGMVQRQSWIKELTGNSNVTGLISLLDTPGGQADGTPQISSYINSLKKPKIAVILGGAYSAGAWIFAAHDAVYASDKYSRVGSIGAYTTVVDYTGYFEQAGIKMTEIYPEISKDKNLSYRKALAGDLADMKKEIHDLAFSFTEEFAAFREGKLTSDEWNTGKVFNTEDAIRIGLIDGIMSLEDVANQISSGAMFSQVKKVFSQAKTTIQSTLNNSNNQQTNMNFPNVIALAGIQNATQAQLDQANADLATAGVVGHAIVPESMITDAANLTAERDSAITERDSLTGQLETANNARATAENDLATANTNLDTANARIAELEAENTRLGALPGATHQNQIGNDTPPSDDGEAEYEALMNALPHNQKADRLLS